MNSSPSGTELVDWLAGLLRAFHPLRWLLCLAGLGLTGLTLLATQSYLDPDAADSTDWWARPIEHAQELRNLVLDQSLGGTILRGGPLLALLLALWSLVGGWIARAELLARRRGRPDLPDENLQPAPTAFL